MHIMTLLRYADKNQNANNAKHERLNSTSKHGNRTNLFERLY